MTCVWKVARATGAGTIYDSTLGSSSSMADEEQPASDLGGAEQRRGNCVGRMARYFSFAIPGLLDWGSRNILRSSFTVGKEPEQIRIVYV